MPGLPPEIFGPSVIALGPRIGPVQITHEFDQDIKCSRAGQPRPSCEDLAEKTHTASNTTGK